MDNTGSHRIPLSKRMSFEWRGLWSQTGVRSCTLDHCPPPLTWFAAPGRGASQGGVSCGPGGPFGGWAQLPMENRIRQSHLCFLCLRFISLSGICSGPTCPFAKTQAHRSYCFKNNFLALNLKLNCPLRVSYFVCSCLSCGSTTLAPSPLVGVLKVGGISVLPPSLLQGAGPTCPPEAEEPQCSSEGQI